MPEPWGAAAAATAAEAIFNANQDRIAAGLSEEEKQDLRQHCIDMGKYAALAAAVISGRDPEEALRAATVAVEENFGRHYEQQLQNAALAIADYSLYEDLVTGRTEEGLAKLAKQGLVEISQDERGQTIYTIKGAQYVNADEAFTVAFNAYPTMYNGLKEHLRKDIEIVKDFIETLGVVSSTLEAVTTSPHLSSTQRQLLSGMIDSSHINSTLAVAELFPQTYGEFLFDVSAGYACGKLIRPLIEGAATVFSKVSTKLLSKAAVVNVKKLSTEVADALGGTISRNKSGYTINIPHKKTNIVVRIMEHGGQRSEPYFRVAMEGKGAFTKEGILSSERIRTHIPLNGNSLNEILSIIKKIKDN